MRPVLATLNEHPRIVALVGTAAGWASVDWLRAAQFAAALLSGLVTLCALILTAPKAVREVRSWFR